MKFTYYPDTAIKVSADEHYLIRLPAFIQDDDGKNLLSMYIWFSYINHMWVEVIEGKASDVGIDNIDRYVYEQLGSDVEYYMNMSYEVSKIDYDLDLDVNVDDKELKELTEAIRKLDLI